MAMRLNSFEFAEEVLDQVPPFVHLSVQRDGFGAARVLRNDDFCAALVKICDDVVAVEGFVGEQGSELDTLDQRGDTDTVEAVAGHQAEADKVAQGIGQRQYPRRHAAFGAANGLALSPPPFFAPWPCRWTSTIAASIIVYSMSGSSDMASKSLLETSASRQSRKRRNAVLQLPNMAGDHAMDCPFAQSTALPP
ncbi:hypothetical protein SPH9361_04643 [Sphingobium sp. CECT 9361]|nr:hypothetical protein SPH9361_04643 [Sphingobium sp. CECT 9361]